MIMLLNVLQDLAFTSEFALKVTRNDFCHAFVAYFECAFTQVSSTTLCYAVLSFCSELLATLNYIVGKIEIYIVVVLLLSGTQTYSILHLSTFKIHALEADGVLFARYTHSVRGGNHPRNTLMPSKCAQPSGLGYSDCGCFRWSSFTVFGHRQLPTPLRLAKCMKK